MKVHFEEFIDEIDELIGFLTSETWEFFGVPNPDPEKIRASFKNQFYTGDDCKTFWIISDENIKIGMLRIYDIEDGTPLFDLRISGKYKGMGIGEKAVNWLSGYIFNNFSDKERIEGTTRQDNYAMRCVFHKCGYVKEAQYRKAWKDKDGKAYDSIGYGITKEDWENGKTSPVNWNDFKC